MKRTRRWELLRLILPCAALASYAYYLHLQPKENSYSLVLDEVVAKPWIEGQTLVSMVLRMKGPWPDRFGRGNCAPGSYTDRAQVGFCKLL
jgi:hypothetical protein